MFNPNNQRRNYPYAQEQLSPIYPVGKGKAGLKLQAQVWGYGSIGVKDGDQ